ncbi:YggT family protein [Agarivorans sp. Toyoura001]|uniref:YggT family protein n=1 Tax=unclassified Agarivorans TaxID=2636026 RepID=UPI0010DE6C22|nr:YggT family protein [Agarivorans sp. Toyoura001]GDY27053.1 membrane protein [Agarivorans sp. Toyoura001]
MQASSYLIEVVFNLYLMVVLLRVWLQLARADFYNPLSQFVVKVTNPVVVPLRRIIPGFAGVDWAAVVIAFAVVAAKWVALYFITGGQISTRLGVVGFDLSSVPLLSLVNIIKEAGMLLFWVLLLRAILSWVSQGRSPVEYVLGQLTEPLLSPIRRILPSIGGLDLSVLVLFIGLNFLNLLIGEWFYIWQIV